MLRLIIEQKFYGHSLIEPNLQAGKIIDVQLIPRHHVRPEYGMVVLRHTDQIGPRFDEGPYANQLLAVGDKFDLGILFKCAPYVLYKQGDYADWANFCELFGIPIREYKYNPHDPTSRKEVEKQAKEAGSASYMIVPEGVGLTLHDAAGAQGGASDLYGKLIDSLNRELSIGILGQTLTTSNEGAGTYALGKVHMSEQDEIHYDDMQFVEGVLNSSAARWMRFWGVPLKNGYKFEYDISEKLSMNQRIDIDTKLNSVIEIDPLYFYEAYQIPIPPGGPAKAARQTSPNGPGQEQTPEEEDEAEAEAAFRNEIQAIYAENCDHSHDGEADHGSSPQAIGGDLVRAFLAMVKKVFDGKLPKGSIDKGYFVKTAEYLFNQGFKEGFGKFDVKDKDFLQVVHGNLYAFSGAKTVAQLVELRDAVFQDGKRVSFTDFRKKAKEIWKEYNENWLRAEYDAVVRAGVGSQKWRDAERTKKLYPYLEYVTKKDKRVRPEHKALHGIVLPIDSSFWDRYTPPNGWGCRCIIEKVSQSQIDSGEKVLDVEKDAKGRGAESVSNKYWLGNPGKTGFVFRDSHPYFKRVGKDEQRKIDKIIKEQRNKNELFKDD